MSKRIKEKYDESDKLEALAKFLDIEYTDPVELEDLITITNNDTFRIGKEEYLVLTDKEADEKFIEEQDNLFEDMGILTGFTKSALQYIINNCIDNKDFFKSIRDDEIEMFVESPESYSNYFDIDIIREDILKLFAKGDRGLLKWLDSEGYDKEDTNFEEDAKTFLEGMDDDEVLEATQELEITDDYAMDAVDKYFEQFDSAYDYLEDVYGKDMETISEMLEPYIDKDLVIEYVKKEDGRGASLATYDGEENEENDFYIYRID